MKISSAFVYKNIDLHKEKNEFYALWTGFYCETFIQNCSTRKCKMRSKLHVLINRNKPAASRLIKKFEETDSVCNRPCHRDSPVSTYETLETVATAFVEEPSLSYHRATQQFGILIYDGVLRAKRVLKLRLYAIRLVHELRPTDPGARIFIFFLFTSVASYNVLLIVPSPFSTQRNFRMKYTF